MCNVAFMLRSIPLVFPSRKSGCLQNSEFPTWKYDISDQWNDISYWKLFKYEFPSPVERGISQQNHIQTLNSFKSETDVGKCLTVSDM